MARGSLKIRFLCWGLFGLGGCSAIVAAEPEILPVGETYELTEGQARERITALRAEIAWHDELYFKKAAPLITDFAYDQLKRELNALQLAWPDLKTSPSQAGGVGDDRAGGFSSYRHRVPMLSLRKSYTEDELKAFDSRLRRQLARAEIAYVVEPKFDGVAVSVTYKNGKLVRAVTRGNGEEGDEVTVNLRAIARVPEILKAEKFPDLVELRGEVWIGWEEFRRLNRERERDGLEPYATPRNLVAGTLKSAGQTDTPTRQAEIVFYGYGSWEPADQRPDSQSGFLQELGRWGLPTVAAPRRVKGFEALWAAVQEIGRERGRYPFPTDGVVVKVDDTAARQIVGDLADAPGWAMAYKFAPTIVETRLVGITWQVGRSGVLTPVAELAPVMLEGSWVKRATLHNREEIIRRDFRPGDYVWIEKAGEIVPAITGVNRAKRAAGIPPYAMPTICPACGKTVQLTASGGDLQCPDPSCPGQVSRRIGHFAEAVGIHGLGPVMADKLVKSGLVATIADLYRLKLDQLAALDGMGRKSADALIKSIERSRRAELWKFIYGLGIPRVGRTGAKALARHFGGLGALAKVTGHDSVPGLSAGAMLEVGAFFLILGNQKLIMELPALGVVPI